MSQSFLYKLSAEDALADSSPLRTLLDSLPEQVYFKDTEGRYVLNNSMAHTLGLAVIVEGVEDEDQVAELKELGCEIAQGHYFAEPLSSEAAERLLVEGSSW
jgi:c-di-GMP-related signal transduction protein